MSRRSTPSSIRHGGRDGGLPGSSGTVDRHQEGAWPGIAPVDHPLQVVGEAGIAGLDGVESGDEAALAGPRRQGGHRPRHGHPVVTPTVEAGAPERSTDAGDGERVAFDRGGGAEGLHHVHHRGQPVDLLHA